MTTTTEPTGKKDVKSTEKKSGSVPVKRESGAPLDEWRAEMEDLMSDMFEKWSEFGRLTPFRDFLPKSRLDANSLDEWTSQADRYFDDFYRRWAHPLDVFKAPPGILLRPEMDVSDGEDKLVVKAELPGMEKDDVDVELADAVLTISGKKSEDKEDTEDQCTVRERRFGSFQRSFTLPDNIVADKIKADFDKGVLTVTVPKKAKPKSKGRKIPVKGE